MGQGGRLRRALIWLILFFAAPLLIVARLSLSEPVRAQPPYTPVFSFADGWAGFLRSSGN